MSESEKDVQSARIFRSMVLEARIGYDRTNDYRHFANR